MSEQPEALKMADLNANCALAWTEGSEPYQFRMDTAALLRRQHARIEADEALMREVIKARDTYGWSVECDEKLNALRSRLETK